jgi:hypothetical protein
MQEKGMLGDNEALRRIVGGPLLDLLVKLNSRGDVEEQLNLMLRNQLMPIPVSKPAEGVEIVKTLVQKIGGGRTTDEIIAAAWKLPEKLRPSFIDKLITQANMVSGYGPARNSLLEFGQFDHGASTEEVVNWQWQPGYGPVTYEDGLRFQEDHPDDQREQPHIFIPENPYCDVDGGPQALDLWGSVGGRELGLDDCEPDDEWGRDCVFARRKFALESFGK